MITIAPAAYNEERIAFQIDAMATDLKKGSLVRAIATELEGSVELLASDARIPSYILETNGEILDIKGDYALVRFSRPTPNVWLRLDQLQAAA